MADQRRAGLIQVKANGEIYDAKGSFTCGYGRPKREAIVGADGVHGYKETPQVAFVEGAITDKGTLDVPALVSAKDVTVTVDFSNGKTFVLRDGWFAGDGTITTEESEIPVRWEGANAEEIS
jgi:hypothetical protein